MAERVRLNDLHNQQWNAEKAERERANQRLRHGLIGRDIYVQGVPLRTPAAPEPTPQPAQRGR